MGMTDPISDLLTRIRNAILAQHDAVEVPTSKMKERIVAILKEEGYVQDYSVLPTKPSGTIRVELRYYDDRQSVVIGLQRMSRPGRRAYFKCEDIPKIRDGLGVGIISTSRGVMTDRAARRNGVGGELVCAVW